MSWVFNNNSNQVFPQPATRYSVYYNEEDPRFGYRQYNNNWSPVRNVYRVKALQRPSGFRAWCPAQTSRVLGCAVLGSLVVLGVIAAAVAAVIVTGKGSSNFSPNSTTSPAGSSTSVSRPAGSEGPGVVTGAGQTQTGPGPVTWPAVVSTGDATIGPGISPTGPVDKTLAPGVSVESPNPAVTREDTTKANSTATTKMSSESTGPKQTGAITERASSSTENSASPGDIKVTQTGPGVSQGAQTTKEPQTRGSETSTTSALGGTVTSAGLTTRPPLESCPTQPILIYQRASYPDSIFNRSWADMKAGFGSQSGEYWRGLDDISALTRTGNFKLLIMITSRDTAAARPVNYDTFTVGDESTGYVITISGFASNFTTDAFQNYSGYKFSTYDRNSGGSGPNCASDMGGAWWYPAPPTCSCGACFTQTEFIWRVGFYPLSLQQASMYLVCK